MGRSATNFSHMSCLWYFACAVLALALPSEDHSLRRSASPFQTRILETGTTFAQENNGVWQLIDSTGDGIPDLAYIKTSNTGTGTVEVHIASQNSGFQNRIFEAGTTFALENDGTWLLVPSKVSNLPDLVLIKTSNTPSGQVEVHIASGASGYKIRTMAKQVPTVFANENSGTWSMYDWDSDGYLDLVYIKTGNASSGRVEIHVAAGVCNYCRFDLHVATTFAPEDNGFWSLAPYSSNKSADIIYIKDVQAGTGEVEVHVASASSNYQNRILEVRSTFAEETNGVWSLMDFNMDGRLDLTYIKYQNAGTGTVEVHVAAG